MSEDETGNNPSIRVIANGPLVVKNLPSLRNARGEPMETKETLILCRCGLSAKKPFCDATHGKAGFSGENTADQSADRPDAYAGRDLTIHDNRFLCAHVGICSDTLPAVFRTGQEPWIDPDGAGSAAIMEVVRRCPSGALAGAVLNPEPGEGVAETGITVSRNGPYTVTGEVELEAVQWGKGADPRRYALCRCGASKNKPFCDGSHWEAGFEDGGG